MFKPQQTTKNIKPQDNKEILKKHFSHCFSKNGDFDFDKFKKEIAQNGEINFSKESYGMEFLGKSYARLLASDSAKTLLQEDKEFNQKQENKNSNNLLLKGDNLEILKHLSNAYNEKIKMIYIDPPYNTGSDGFVYNDNRKFSIDEFSHLAGVDEEDATRILSFVDSKSNSHSAWLTFMYPRLYIAKQLLKDDGVIFVSIDDNEVAQLRLLMDEIFGEQNFVAEFIWSGKSGSEDDSHIRNNKEYILSYAKMIDDFNVGLDIKKDEKFIYYDKIKKDFYKRQLLRKWGDNSKREDRPNLYYPIKDSKGDDFYPTLPNGEDGCWRWSQETMALAIKNFKIDFAINGKYEAYEKIYKSDASRRSKKFQSLLLELGSSAIGTKEIKFLFNSRKIFSNPKPTKLLNQILKIANIKNDDIALDFFAGSGTTGDAVMQLNTEDGGERKFILAQLPEQIDEKKNKTAYDFVKNDLGINEPTIFEITKERLIRSSNKIQEENKKDLTNIDFGFKIFETIPNDDGVWENYDIEADEFDEQMSLFDEHKLSKQDIDNLLLTWKTNDNIPLTNDLESIDFDGYEGKYFKTKLYLMNEGFKMKHLTNLLEKIDNDKDFNPQTIIAFAYNFESKALREISEAIKSYANKKGVEVWFVGRY